MCALMKGKARQHFGVVSLPQTFACAAAIKLTLNMQAKNKVEKKITTTKHGRKTYLSA